MACRGPEPFTISHWSNSGQVMERKRGVLLSMLSALQSRIIRIIKIIKMIVIIGIIKIFSIIGIIETSSKIRRKERGIPFGHLCTDGMVSSGRGHWLLYVLNICKGKNHDVPSWANAKNYTVRNQESWRLQISIPITENGDNYSPLHKKAM